MTEKAVGTWGRSSRSNRVHYYKDGMTLCGQSRKMDMEFPDWNPDDPDTCKKCREWEHWIRKGGKIVVARTTQTA